jgi:hypothetical protein
MKCKTNDELLMNIFDFVSIITFGVGLVLVLGDSHFFVKTIGLIFGATYKNRPIFLKFFFLGF